MEIDEKEWDKMIEACVKGIEQREKDRKAAGKNPETVHWHAELERLFGVCRQAMIDNEGKLISTVIDGDEDLDLFNRLSEKLDLPPAVNAMLLTRAACRYMDEELGIRKKDDPIVRDPRFYLLVVSKHNDTDLIITVNLPGTHGAHVKVYREGELLLEITYTTASKFLNDISRIVWIYFKPDEPCSANEIIRYTDNWYYRRVLRNSNQCPFHPEFSYIHHPELIGLSQLEATFKLARMIIIKTYTSDADELLNDIEEIADDNNEPTPNITERLWEGDIDESNTFMRVIMDLLDSHLTEMTKIIKIKFPKNGLNNKTYLEVYKQTALRMFRDYVGRDFPGEFPPPLE